MTMLDTYFHSIEKRIHLIQSHRVIADTKKEHLDHLSAINGTKNSQSLPKVTIILVQIKSASLTIPMLRKN